LFWRKKQFFYAALHIEHVKKPLSSHLYPHHYAKNQPKKPMDSSLDYSFLFHPIICAKGEFQGGAHRIL
jgi:hypothetical protein